MGQVDDALADYDAALKLNPKSPAALFGSGLAKGMTGDDAASAANIEAAKALKPGIAEEFARYGLKTEFKPAN